MADDYIETPEEPPTLNEFGNPVPRIVIRPAKPEIEYDDTEIPDPEKPTPYRLLQHQQDMQGVMPDGTERPQERKAAWTPSSDELAEINKKPWKLSPEDFAEERQIDYHAKPLPDTEPVPEGEPDNEDPYQVAGLGPKFMKELEKAILPHPGGGGSHLPPPPVGHNSGPAGIGPVPPHGPTGPAVPPPAAAPPPTGGGSKILYGVSDQKPFDLHDLYTETLDDLHPIKRLQDDMAKIRPLSPEEKAYELARLTRGSPGRAHQAIANETFDFNTLANNGPGLTQVLAPVRGDIRGFDAYARAMRTIELHGRGINSGQPLAEAQNIVNSATPEMQQALHGLYGYQDRILSYARDSGLLSEESYNAIKQANQNYVPLHRAMEPTHEGGLARAIRTYVPIKRIKGSDKDTLSPIETVVRNTHYLIDLAEKNRALNALVDAAMDRGGVNGLVTPVKRSTHPIQVTQEEVERFLTSNGIPVPGNFYGAPDHFTIFRPDALRPDKNHIVVYKDGKPQMFRVDPDVADAVNGMGAAQVSMLSKIAAAPASWLRAGAVLSPDLLTKNPFRDQLVATTLSDNGYAPVVTYLRGLGHFLGNTEQYQNWLKSGGANAVVVGMDRRYIEEELRTLMQSGAWNAVKRNVMHPMEFLKKAAEIGEQPTRIGEFLQATNPGFLRRSMGAQPKTLHEGAYDSREVTVDFQRRGGNKIIQEYTRQTAFANPAAQGVDRAGRALNPFIQDPKKAGAAWFRLAATTTVPGLGIYYYNRQDPRMKDVPRWERDLFWHWPTDDWQEVDAQTAKMLPPNWMKQENGKTMVNLGTIFKFPKNFEMGVVGSSLFERALDQYFTEYPDAWKDFDKTMRQVFLPGVLPTWGTPMLEQFTNYSMFRDRPLVSRRVENPANRSLEYDHYTSNVAKMIGSAVANISPTSGFASPKVIENYVYGWTGTNGRYAMQLADALIDKASPTPEGIRYPTWKGRQTEKFEKKERTWADMPLVRSWISRMPSTFAEPVDEFYNHLKEVTASRNTERRMSRVADKAGAAKAAEFGLPLKLERTAKALATQFKLIDMITMANNIPGEDKTKLIEQRSLAIMKMAQQGNAMYEEMKGKKQKQKEGLQ